MRVSGSRKQDNIHYISTEAITVKSNAGEITIGEGVENIYDFDNVRATNTFYFNPRVVIRRIIFNNQRWWFGNSA